MAAGNDGKYFTQLDAAFTEVIRLARDPRLTARMSVGIDEAIDRRLLLLLNLIADRGPVRASDLVAVMAVDQSTVSRQLAALIDHGLVTRSTDPSDRRAALVAITREGRAAIGIARQAWQRTLAELTVDWSTEQRAALLHSLDQLAGGLATVISGE